MVKSKLLLLMVALVGLTYQASAQKVTLDFQRVKLEKVLSSITQQTGYDFNYSLPVVNPDKIVSIKVSNADFSSVIPLLFPDGKVGYVIKDKVVFLTDNSNAVTRQPKSGGELSGLVTDDKGSPIVGATVIIQGTVSGTSTGADGKFTLNNVAPGSVVEISCIGYGKQTITIHSQTKITVVMEEDSAVLDEVVVVGYGVQRRSDVTGSVSSVKADELLSAPSSSTAQALQGRVSGVMVQNASGHPSGDVVIRIRGANSLTYGNDPLVIIDGVQDGNIGGLNPNEVESIEVLKDAAALSIYGSRGANGVILVTTKSGKGAKIATVSYNGYIAFDKVSKTLDALDATQYATLFNEYRKENGQSEFFSDPAAMGKGTDWQDAIFRNGLTHSHNVSIGGSSEKISYFVSGSLLDKKGIMLNTNYRQYSLRANLKVQATKWLSFGLNSYMTADDAGEGEIGQAITSALQWSPTKPIYDASTKGGYSQPGGGVGPNSADNPVGLLKEPVNDKYGNSFNLAPQVEAKITDWLKFSSQYVYKSNNRNSGYFDNQVVNDGPVSNTSGSLMTSRYTSQQNTNILSFDKTFGRDHHLSATLVYEISKDKYESNTSAAKGIPINLGYHGLQFGATMLQPWVEYSATSMQSVMGRINYAYKNRYMISLSDRYDGASQLADGHKWDNFAAVSLGWNLAEERFMEGTRRVIDELKIRGSYGSVGNAAVPAYSSKLKFTSGYDSNNNPILEVSQLNNENLKWERTTETNVGLDLRMFNSRFNFTAEYYSKKTTDLLMWQKVPTALGVESVLNNVGAVSNKGVDIAISGYPVSGKNFTWNTNLTFNYNKNRILELDGLSNRIVYTSDADYPGTVGSFVQEVGQPMGTFLGYIYDGVWKTSEASLAAVYGAVPGDAKYRDIDNNQKIDSKDITIIGNAQPEYIFGWNNTFAYKGFELNMFWQGVAGNDIYNQNRIRRESTSSTFPTSNVILNRWTPTNQHTDIPSFTGVEYLNSSRWVEDGSYLRLKNLSLAYNFSHKLLVKTRFISAAKIYVSASNIWTITDYKGYDPEASIGSDATAAGVDRGIYPSSKSWIIGLELKF